jgi:hypothetical protein
MAYCMRKYTLDWEEFNTGKIAGIKGFTGINMTSQLAQAMKAFSMYAAALNPEGKLNKLEDSFLDACEAEEEDDDESGCYFLPWSIDLIPFTLARP